MPLAERAVHGGRPLRMLDATALLQSPPPAASSGPLVTVAVRSRTAASRLQPCLDSLLRLDYPSLDLVLIDASDDRKHVEALVRDQYPRIRYTSAPGLGMASRRAIAECRGDILAVTDGDAIVDRRWVSALVHVFLSDPEVMTVSGLAVPQSLRRPFRPTLPAGAPFCRHWWRAREDCESIDGATQRAAGANQLQRGVLASGRIAAGALHARLGTGGDRADVGYDTACCAVQPGAGWCARSIASVDLRSRYRPNFGRLHLRQSSSASHVGQGEPLGTVRIAHHGAVVSRLWIEDAIAQQLTAPVLDAGLHLGPQVSQASADRRPGTLHRSPGGNLLCMGRLPRRRCGRPRLSSLSPGSQRKSRNSTRHSRPASYAAVERRDH